MISGFQNPNIGVLTSDFVLWITPNEVERGTKVRCNLVDNSGRAANRAGRVRHMSLPSIRPTRRWGDRFEPRREGSTAGTKVRVAGSLSRGGWVEGKRPIQQGMRIAVAKRAFNGGWVPMSETAPFAAEAEGVPPVRVGGDYKNEGVP
jgi:hypothetical protein